VGIENGKDYTKKKSLASTFNQNYFSQGQCNIAFFSPGAYNNLIYTHQLVFFPFQLAKVVMKKASET
jgi:hypothetical protein